MDDKHGDGRGRSTVFQLGNKERIGRRERGCRWEHAIGARDRSMLALHDVEAAVLGLYTWNRLRLLRSRHGDWSEYIIVLVYGDHHCKEEDHCQL